MKTFLQYLKSLAGLGGQKPTPRYRGTAVVVDTHGSHAKDRPQTYKGTPAVVDTHGDHSSSDKKPLKKVDENAAPASREVNFYEWNNENDNSHLGETSSHVHQKLTGLQPHNDFSAGHRKAIKKYTEESSALNRSLLTHYVAGTHPGDKIGEHSIPHLDEAVKHHRLNHDLHVYSGVGFHPGRKAAMDPENKIHLPAYTSTSINKKTAVVFSKPLSEHGDARANHVLHIHLKKGQKGLYVGEHSAVGNEHEYLLPRNTTLKVHPVPTILPRGSHFSNMEPVHVWHAHVVPNEPADPRQIPLDLKDR